MATNPLISLQARGVDFGQAAGRFAQASQARKGREQQQEIIDLRKQQLDLERVRTAYEQQEAADKRRFRNTAIASAQLKRVLESDGPDAAMTWLQNNQEGNERIGLPSEDTQEAMELIQAGKVDQLKTGLDNNVFLGESLGLVDTPEEWEPIYGDQGNIIGQRNTKTGRTREDVRSDAEGQTRDLTPEEVKEAGFPEGSVVQRKPNNDLVVRFEPDTDRGSDQRDREIADLASDLDAQGVPDPRVKATRIVDGRARIEVSEDGSRAVFVDEVALASGDEDAVRELQLREPEQGERAEIEPADSLFAMADKATGPQATLRSVTARIPFTNVSEGERETVTARRAFELTENELARGLVNNPRFPVREREAVINAINISPSVFDNPDAMKARLSAARDFLQTRLAQAERDAGDETLPEETRQDQAANASAMRNAIDRIGVPAEEIASTIQQITDLDAESARFVVDDMPQQNLREMINNASDEDLGDLSDETRVRIAERLRGQ